MGRIFLIEDVTLGDVHRDHYLVRYHGKLRQEDSAAAYDQLALSLKPYALMPLFRWEDDRQTVFVVPGNPPPKPSKAWVNLVLFILTLFSVMLTGGMYGLEGQLPSDPLQLVLALLANGWPFALSLIAILGAHEFGHYLAGRYHGVHVTLPYFIPFPLSSFGTMGAFINMKETPKNRRHLFDIGVAGPFAGLVVAIPVLILGLSLSRIEMLPSAVAPQSPLQLEGNSILYLLLKLLVFGRLLPAPATFGDLSPLVYWLRYFFTGSPAPLGGMDVMLHPVAWAGWAGILVTSLNLIPAGQLDGGHILYVLIGRKAAERLRPVVLLILVTLGMVWTGWWFWAVLVFVLGRGYDEPMDQITELDGRRKALAVLAMIIFVITFSPVPLVLLN